MEKLLDLLRSEKDVSAWDFFVPSKEDLIFIYELENNIKEYLK